MIQTTRYLLKKPENTDMADLRVYVGDNMDILETQLSRIDDRVIDWTDVANKPVTFTPPLMATTSVGGARVGNGLAMSGEYLFIKTGTALMIDANYALAVDTSVLDTRYSASGHSHTWTEITGKPTLDNYVGWNLVIAGTPHRISSLEDLTVTGTGNATVSYDGTTGTLTIDSTGGTTAHTHAIADVTGLQTELDSKVTKGAILTDGFVFDLNANDLSALIIEAENYDVNVFRVGNDRDEYGFDLRYIGMGAGNDNILKLISHNQTIAYGSPIDIVNFYQDGTTKFLESVVIETDATHLKFRDSTNAKEYHIETRNEEFRIYETNIAERFRLTPTDMRVKNALNSNVIFESTRQVNLFIRADTDNTDETDVPTLIFECDGGITRTNMGIDANNNFYFQPMHYYGATNQGNASINYKTHDGIIMPMHHDGRIESVKYPSFINGWSNYALSYRQALYWKTQDGQVILEGLIKGGTTGAIAFTLPAGYRPLENLIFTTYSYAGSCRVDVQLDGDVYMNTNTHSTWTSISGITFKAEQ